jgi:hypothetical protein
MIMIYFIVGLFDPKSFSIIKTAWTKSIEVKVEIMDQLNDRIID